VGYTSCARSAQAKEGASVMKLSRSVEGLLLRAYAESRKLEQLKCSQSLPQGVRAKNLVEVEEIWKSSGRIGL
jgi:hypothetical protein